LGFIGAGEGRTFALAPLAQVIHGARLIAVIQTTVIEGAAFAAFRIV
jgi:hypothetical protein